MRSLRETLQVLTLVPAFVGIDTTRHLRESWPLLTARTGVEAPAPDAKASKHLRVQIEEVRQLLRDLLDSLRTSDEPSCRETASNALSVLIERFDKQVPYFLACSGSCRASSARLEEFVDAVRTLEAQLSGCRRTRTLGKWILERETGLKGLIGLQASRASNPRGEPVGTSEISYGMGLGLRGAYRAEKSWHALDAEGALTLFPSLPQDIDYAFKQENVFQMGSQALRARIGLEKRGQWLWNQPIRGTRSVQDLEAGWRLVPGSSRALEIMGRYRSETWVPALWSKRSIGADMNYVLNESIHDDLKFRGGFELETLKGLDAPLFVTRVGVAYERRGASHTSARMNLGLQDRRTSELGAGLWPFFLLALEGRDLFAPGLFPSVSVELSPESTPWSPHTLMAKSSWGLKFVSRNFEIPTEFALSQAFHRGVPGQKRDDRVVGLSLRPKYKISTASSLSLPTTWTQFWTLRTESGAESRAGSYPSNSFKNFETALRLQYEF